MLVIIYPGNLAEKKLTLYKYDILLDLGESKVGNASLMPGSSEMGTNYDLFSNMVCYTIFLGMCLALDVSCTCPFSPVPSWKTTGLSLAITIPISLTFCFSLTFSVRIM